MAGSEALLASQINGGGCLAPPTPQTTANQMLTSTLHSIGGLGDPELSKMRNFERYGRELPPTLAMRPTTITSMVQGMGAFIDQDNLKAPKDLMQLGVVMRNGRPQRIERARTLGGVEGNPQMWRTANEDMNAYWRRAEILSVRDL